MSFKSVLKLLILFAVMVPVFVRADDTRTGYVEFEKGLPLGISAEVWSYFVPKDNPVTAAKVKLGRELFFDGRLSADGSVSCATCHNPDLAFADGKRVAEGIGARRGARNSPSLLNVMFNAGQFWDGRTDTLEAQAIAPLLNPDEMGNDSHQQVVERLGAIPDYAEKFKEVFGGAVTIEAVGKAIAAFERTLVSGNSPLDRFLAGDRSALSEAAVRGLGLFRGKARCSVCHTFNQSFLFFTDQNYRNTGVAANHRAFDSLARRALDFVRGGQPPSRLNAWAGVEGAQELGRFLVTGNSLDIGAFRTPSLRNVELTAPYFHDGSAATLADVVEFYARGGKDNLGRDWELQQVSLADREREDLIEFLKSLTSTELKK